MQVSAKQALTELKREKNMRDRVYPMMIERGKMTEADADKQHQRLLKAIEIVERAAADEQEAQKEPSFL